MIKFPEMQKITYVVYFAILDHLSYYKLKTPVELC